MEGHALQLSSLDIVLAVLCVVVTAAILQKVLSIQWSREGPSGETSASSDRDAVDASIKRKAEVVLPTPAAPASSFGSKDDDPPPKGTSMVLPASAGSSVTPFRAFQDGAPSSDGHVGFRYEAMDSDVALGRADEMLATARLRRSVRFYSAKPIPDGLLERCGATALSAPSGAHLQPWTFLIVRDKAARRAIREAVEEEERLNYAKRMRETWVDSVKPLVSGLHAGGEVTKPYIEEAAALVVVMEQPYGRQPDGSRKPHYYPKESVGIAAGMFISALTNAGLFTLTSTPMGAESAIRHTLGRPGNERVFLLMPVGYPAEDATVPFRDPSAPRKPMSETAVVV